MLPPDLYPILGTLREDVGTEMLLVRRDGDGGRMILKRPKAGAVSGDEAIGLRNEYEIISRHRLSCMLPLIGLVGAFPETGLLFRDVGGQTCDQLERLDQDGLIALADSVATAIGEVHAAGILHRDIRPSNILLTSGRAYILDFARALVGSREHKDIDSPWAMANSLVYLAPEQTGRMNRPVDYRADYYGFGVMLYELATGTPPFRADDPLHLIYDHLATDPIPPERINPAMSSFLSDVVLKLLAKDPDRRYQSVDGLKADLKVAGTIARGDGAGTATVGAFDIPFRFNVSHRLYGRDQERTTLLACFDRVCQGAREMLLIAGYSGVGKTALIRETYIPVTRQKAFFIAGKFDQLQRRQPYGAWIEALRKLMAFVLAEPEARLQSWREHLTTALGQNSGVLMEMIPDLAALLGPQPPPAELPPAEALNRFNQAFRAFIGAFCVPERPLVVFLDDLQWIDAASLNLLSLLTGDPECRYLFLIGACRDNEVSPTHPLMLALVEMKRAAVFSFNEITLPPLAEPHVEHLIADTFAVSVAEARPLARVIGARTAGNPFFLWQFLRTARAEGLVFFDTSAMRWTWRLEAIRQLDCADNVVDLMLYRFNELPPPTRTSLSWAACLGARFDLDTLAILLGVSLPETYATLLPALEQEFVLPLSAPEVASSRLVIRHYRFLHDRMQEAAYRAIVEEERPVSHRRIASLLLANTAEDKLHDRIFEIADHLNLAAPLLVTIDDRLKLARINLMAGRKARESAAYDAALAYLRAGMADLPTDLWESELDLARALHRERGDLEYLNSHFDQAEAFVREALIRETDPLHRADFFHMLVVQYTLRAIYGRAIATAREGLRLLSVDLPEDDFEAARDKELRQVRTLLDGRPLSALADLPVMEDPVQHAVMKLLTSMGPPCYRSHPRLWGVIVAREVRLCLEHGNVPSASYSYPAFGGLLTHVGQGTAGDCADLAAVTLTLMARFASPADTSVGYLMIGSSLRHWFAPLKDASRDYLDAYKTGLDSGNLQYAVYGFGHNTYCRFYQGVPLGELIRETEGYREFCLKRNNLWGIDLTEGALRVFTTLREAEGPHDFSWRGEPEAAYLERCEAHENLQVLCIYHILRAEALLHLERFEAAATSLGEAARRLDSVSTQGLLPTSQFHLLRGLMLAVRPDLLGLAADVARAELRVLRERFAVWSEACPENNRHAYWLLRAEESRLGGDVAAAMDAYDQAMETTRGQGLKQREALAAARAADFWRGRGKAWIAAPCLERASLAYQGWQADGVLAGLTEREPQAAAWRNRIVTLQRLDLETLTDTAQVLSSPLALDDLVEAIIGRVTHLSGAQRVVLVLALDTGLAVALDTEASDTTAMHGDFVALDQATDLPRTVILYVARTHQSALVAADSLDEDALTRDDPYLQMVRPASALCVPLVFMGTLSGVLYLEHRNVAGIFGTTDNQVIEFAAMQAAISIHRSQLLGQLKDEIRARKATEEALRQAHADLKRFADISAHHLMEPARRLISFAQRLRIDMGAHLADNARVSLDFIEDQAGRLRCLLRDVQFYLALDDTAGEPEDIDADQVARVAVEAIIGRFRDVGAIVTVGTLPVTRTTASRLGAVFSIALDNALKYRRPDVPLKVDISGQKTGDTVCYRIMDNGIGIPVEYRERVFRVFERLRPQPGDSSTGIGLAIVRRIANKSGGRAWIEGTPGGGVTVCVELPCGV